MASLGLLLLIIAAALVLFIGGWLSVDVVGLMVLAALALGGIVTPTEALAGFSSSAVVIVWAMFILSAGLTRTGVAYRIGQPLQAFTRSSETVLVIVIMIAASLLSALINTTTVAVILLPAVMDLARRSGRSPSRLLMPLALGCLLGGPFTGISTPSNILVSEALQSAGLAPFGLFEFTPFVAIIVAAGIAFMVFGGLRLLPQSSGMDEERGSLESSYQLGAHLFSVRIPPECQLVGHTLAESHIGSALQLTVVALQRSGRLILAPRPGEVLQANDRLITHGQIDQLHHLHDSPHLDPECTGHIVEQLAHRLTIVSARIGGESPLIGHTLAESGLRRTHQVHVLAITDAAGTVCNQFWNREIEEGDTLLLQAEPEALQQVVTLGLVEDVTTPPPGQIARHGEDAQQLASVAIPEGCILVGRSLVESRLSNAFGLTVVAILRHGETLYLPDPQEVIQTGDLLVVQGSKCDLAVFRGLQHLEMEEHSPQLATELESQRVGVAEVLLSPRTTLAGQTLNDLLFREHYGLNVLAIWRKGLAYRTGLQDMPLKFGDALLVYGPRQNLAAVARDSDFLVLDRAASSAPRLNKAPIATAIMVAVLACAIMGLAPIAIAALTGATLMVVTRCLTMEEAYTAIEWKVVFLVASMLPLGVAIQNTGAAQIGAEALISMVGGMGPRVVVAALFCVTVLGTQIIPTSALVVLMAPIALDTATRLSISPHLLMMTVAIAAASSFASPLSHPAHLLVMGPGGYRFMDYVKVGVPLTLLSLLLSVWLLPLFWPA